MLEKVMQSIEPPLRTRNQNLIKISLLTILGKQFMSNQSSTFSRGKKPLEILLSTARCTKE